MSDIYYDPEKFGLEIIWKAEAELSYEFDIVAAWGSTVTGAIYVGRDSGCSCPSPFEEYTGLDTVNELERVDPQRGRDEVRKTLLNVMGGDPWGAWTPSYDYRYDDDTRGQADREKTASEGADRILAWSEARPAAVTS